MALVNDYEKDISVDTASLEELIQQERDKEITQLHSLSKKVNFLHTDLLYYRNPKSKVGQACYEAWKVLIKKVGGTPNGWRDLGYALGVGQDDLDYIMASVKDDPTDMMLKVYRQNEKATIDKIVDAFVKMNRYDILKALDDPLCTVAQHFQKDDTGYHSNEKSSKSAVEREIISLKNLPNDLPPALYDSFFVQRDKEPVKPEPISLPPVSKSDPIGKDHPILFLTYAQDGLPTAINIQDYVLTWTEIPGVEVITLNGRKDEIYQNPEKFIREYFEKADFVVPIITSGYLEQIRSHDVNIPNTSANLDHRYVKFIYNLIVSNYIHATGCLNKKVRSVLPQNTQGEVYGSITMYPDLLPWTYETNFDEQFQAFLKNKYSI